MSDVLSTGKSSIARPLTCALPDTPLADAVLGLDACVHCGFCLQACPTYVNLQDENDSPRGRIVLMRRMLEGDLPLNDPDVGKHIDRCLGCRACETACPSGVPYGHLLEATRATMAPARSRPLAGRIILNLFARRGWLTVALFFARVLRATRIPNVLARVLPSRLAFPFAMLAASAQTIRPLPYDPDQARTALNDSHRLMALAEGKAPPSEPRPSEQPQTFAMLEGCVMRGLFAHTNDATNRVLQVNGYRPIVAMNQGCCGALHAHAGDLETARMLARANVESFEKSGAEYIAVNAAGCGAMVKEYGHLLRDDPAWSERAALVASRARDVSELLAMKGPLPSSGMLAKVTYDPPCHLMHAQRVVAQPLAMLASVRGLDLIPLNDADQCCGSAGIYNLIEPDTSDAVLAPKLANIADTRASLVATGNPGCMMQIGAGLIRSGSRARVVHPVDLLDVSYSAASQSRTIAEIRPADNELGATAKGGNHTADDFPTPDSSQIS